jgi:transglutaminase superfamily protein
MNKAFLLLCCVFLFASSISAQKQIDYARKLKKQFPKDKVVITNSKVVVEFDQNSKYGIFAKEKIEENFLTLDKNIEFIYPVFYSDDIKIDDYDTGPFSRVKRDDYYTNNGIFHDDIKVKYSHFKIPHFGGESNIKAELIYTDVRYIPNVFFSKPFTILEKEIQFIIPINMDVELIPVNTENYDVVVTEAVIKKNKVITYKINNLESKSKDHDLPGKTYIYPHIFIHVKSYTSDGKKINIFESTSDQYNWYKDLVLDIGNETGALTSVVDGITSSDLTNMEKIERIFYWVQDNIRYIAFEDGLAGFKPASCQKVFNNRYGDCKGMANLTKEMLILAGFDARLVWLGTKRIAYDYSIPSLAVDNHMICAVFYNDEIIYLDATEKYSKMGEYAERIQNRNVLIQNGDTYLLENIPESDADQNKQNYRMDLSLSNDMTINGKLVVDLASESRVELMNIMSTIPKKDWEKAIKYYLSSGNDLVLVTEVNLPELHRDKKYEFSGNLSFSDKISTFDNDAYVYINPFTFFSGSKLVDDRKYALWFDYKKDINLNINLKIPEEWEINSLPETLLIENNEFYFSINTTTKGGSINYSMSGRVPNAEVSETNLTSWNEAISKLNQNYEQPIILRKK